MRRTMPVTHRGERRFDMPQAIWQGAFIAERNDIDLVEGNAYFPVPSVKMEHLRESAPTIPHSKANRPPDRKVYAGLNNRSPTQVQISVT